MVEARVPVPACMVAALLVPSLSAWADPPVVTVEARTFSMKDDTTPPISAGKRKFSWSVRSGVDPEHRFVVPLPGSAGDPTTNGASGGGAVLTVYNSAGSGEVFVVNLPAERWRLQGTPPNAHRFLYANSPATEPVWKVWLKGSKITVRGGKKHWGYSLDEASQGSLAVRLTVGTEATYCSEVFPRLPAEKFDRRNRFLAPLAVPPPEVCPPVP